MIILNKVVIVIEYLKQQVPLSPLSGRYQVYAKCQCSVQVEKDII